MTKLSSLPNFSLQFFSLMCIKNHPLPERKNTRLNSPKMENFFVFYSRHSKKLMNDLRAVAIYFHVFISFIDITQRISRRRR